jgi:hypothetical protein
MGSMGEGVPRAMKGRDEEEAEGILEDVIKTLPVAIPETFVTGCAQVFATLPDRL